MADKQGLSGQAGRVPSEPGSREPSPSVPLVSAASGFDPSREALKVWWVPQVPMKAFEASVPDLATASAILDVLADYDAFQFENNVKGDYCNIGGLMVLRDGEWEEWEDPVTYDEFDKWRDENLPRIRTNGWGRPLSDSDGSPEGEDALAASSETTARAEGIAPSGSDQPS